uniref:BPTI/Kunitz inhibitor domain-containing protein n=1 Tax=Sander lucioperca TaxID=283035 RepID=A0A8C9X8U5_SANLU
MLSTKLQRKFLIVVSLCYFLYLSLLVEVCDQPPEPGLCGAYIPRYFYNSSSMSCQLFIYGGCTGNQNNFKTEKEYTYINKNFNATHSNRVEINLHVLN